MLSCFMSRFKVYGPYKRTMATDCKVHSEAQRAVLNGILWILRTGAPWADLPHRYPPKSTCHRRFQEWTKSRVFAKILTALARDLRERGNIDLREGFIDGSFAPAKKGAMVWARPKGAKEPKLWALQTLAVFLSPLTQPVPARMK
jgi:transposase